MLTHADGAVVFLPEWLADFVVHYNSAAFYVHTFVLHRHSAHFRAYFDTLDAAQPLTGCSSDHPAVAYCVQLPLQMTLVGNKAVRAKDFELFLRHFYFGAHYCYPPFLPRADVAFATPTVASLQFTPVPLLDWSTALSPVRFTTADGTIVEKREALLTLAQYLDCALMTAQCEAVLLLWLQYVERRSVRPISECLR